MGRIFHVWCDNPMCYKDDGKPHPVFTEAALRTLVPEVPKSLIVFPKFHCSNCLDECNFEMEETSVGSKIRRGNS